MAAKILVIDDDPNVQRLLQYSLRQEGYEVVIAGDGAEGFRLWGAEAPDLILLDVMLPKLDGYQVATKIRSEEGSARHVPIIMLTAEREVEQKVRGLRAGADDYLIKPFDMAELLARVEALLRRGRSAGGRSQGTYAFGELRVDFRRAEVVRGRKVVPLSGMEFKLLSYLIEHRGALLTRNELLDKVWGYEALPQSRTIDVHVASLRQKLERVPAHPELIVTVHRQGYRFMG